MDPESLKQFYFLKMRKACADMEHATQRAAYDQFHYGSWRKDWAAMYTYAEKEYVDTEALLRQNCFL